MGKEGVRYLTWSVPLLHALMTLVDFVDMLDLEQVCLREDRVQVLHVGVMSTSSHSTNNMKVHSLWLAAALSPAYFDRTNISRLLLGMC